MDLRSKQKIRLKEKVLRDGIKIAEITPYLIENAIISIDDEERIRKEVTSSDKAMKLLRIVEMHPKGYPELLKAFRGSSTTAYLGETLEKTKIDEQKIKDEEDQWDQVIKEVLIKSFCQDKDYNTPLAVVEDAVKYEFILRMEHYNINNKHLIDLITSTFKGCNIKKPKKKKELYCHNIRQKGEELESEEDDDKHQEIHEIQVNDERETVTGTDTTLRCGSQNKTKNESDRPKKTFLPANMLNQLSPADLSLRISALEDEYELPNEVSQTILSKKIPGKIFAKLKFEYVKHLFPNLSEVEVAALLCLRDEILEKECSLDDKKIVRPTIQQANSEECDANIDSKLTTVESMPSVALSQIVESFRAFDREIKKSDCYRQHSTLSSSTTRPSNMLEPVHLFTDVSVEKIGDEIVEFAAACLNERSNGTIHFGVRPHYDDYKMEGEVLGINFNKEQCLKSIYRCIENRFYKEQVALVYKCLRPPQFVEVVPSSQGRKLSVLEVDVVPKSTLIDENAFFVKSSDSKRPVLYLFRDKGICPYSASDEKSVEYMSKLRICYSNTRRQLDYPNKYQLNRNDLRVKILEILTAGDEEMSGSDYPLLFLSPLGNRDRGLIDFNEFEFLIDLDANAIFDFDNVTTGSKGLFDYIEHTKEQVLKVLTTDDFDPNSDKNRLKKDAYPNLIEDMKLSVIKPWLFCNGYQDMDKPQLNTMDWKQMRSKGVREAIRFYSNEIPPGRARVYFFLFSKDYEIMLEAANDVVVDFKDQWIVFAESEEVADHWRSQMIKRHLVDKKTVEQRTIVGMPWKHVNQTIKQLTGAKRPARCEIATSTGAFCHLKEKKRNELCDLEILSRNECEDQEMTPDELENLRLTEESNFYRGKKVTWWNFWFPNHVLERNVHQRLKSKVTDSLQGQRLDDDNKVGLVNIFHQPGAGGSTTARQMLWDLRKTYRCCIVRQLTDQTVDQIAAFRSYEETDDPKPPLVLIENRDDEKVAEMVAFLQHKARVVARRNADVKVFCVILLCTRRTNISSIDKSSEALKHELTEKELQWFREKYDKLEEAFAANRGPDPRFLFSFNILKENFNTDYIKNTASRLVEGVENQSEHNLLKYLSLMNTFDLEQLSVPVGAFDPIMTIYANDSRQQTRKQNRYMEETKTQHAQQQGKQKPWEKTMSQPLQILLNTNMKAGFGSQLKGFSIINSRFASEIYSCFNEEASTSSIVFEFLDSVLFKGINHSKKDLKHIVRNMMKKREDKDDRKAKFSPLILKIIDEEDGDMSVATNVLIRGFELTDDPMICQQVARIYISCKNWKEAVRYAQRATDMKPYNSYLWDTFGQVYKGQLITKYTECCQENKLLSVENIEEVIETARKGMDIFRKEQEVSERERSTRVNEAGYYGEVRMVILLLDTLTFSPLGQNRNDLHSYLVDEKSEPACMLQLKPESISFFKSLEKRAEETMKLIEDKTTQFKEDKFFSIFGSTQDHWRKSVAHIRENLDNYFGEESDKVPEQYTEEDKAHFRRRRVRRLGGRTLYNFLRIENKEKLTVILNFLLENMQSDFWQPFDAVGLINTVLAMNILNIRQSNLNYIDLVDISRKCYQKVSTEKRAYLEAFMYFMLFNWPTESRQRKNQPVCSSAELKEATKKWKDAFLSNHPRQKEGGPVRKKETTIFFLGRGDEMKSLVHYDELVDPEKKKFSHGDQVWESPDFVQKLQRLSGTLLQEGNDISYQFDQRTGGVTSFNVQTSFPIRSRSLWQKRVYFVLGFSWSGIRAYDVRQDKPDLPKEPPQSHHPQGKYPKASKKQPIQTHELFMERLQNIQRQIDDTKSKCRHKGAIKGNLRDKIDELERKKENLIKERGEFYST